ncbi:MAG: hypoxanthine phosphoribosyltransferase [Rikenellaceae bacterium]
MQKKIKLYDLHFEKMIGFEEIDAAVSRVAEQINRDYANSATPPILLSILNGSFMFASDLCKKLDFCPEIAFVKLSSYEGTGSTGKVKNLIGVNSSIEGRDVIIVEDIVDSGNTIVHIDKTIKEMGVTSVRYCSLFLKPESYTKDIKIDYVAMQIGNEFIVGYGLDYKELGRNLQDIYVICDE